MLGELMLMVITAGTPFALVQISATGRVAHFLATVKRFYPGRNMNPDRDSAGSTRRLEGRYANYLAIGYNQHEFVIDFGQSYSDNDSPKLCTRIVTGPVYAKSFLKMMRDSIDTFEATYGTISDDEFENSDQ